MSTSSATENGPDPQAGRAANAGASAGAPALEIGRIVIPVDFSECSREALAYAQQLGARFRSTLMLVHVLEPVTPYPIEVLSRPPDGGEDESVLYFNDVRQALERWAADAAEASGLEVDSRAVVGRAYPEIVRIAAEMQANLIVIGTHGHRGLKQFLLGSTAEKVVRHATCPVLVVRQAAG